MEKKRVLIVEDDPSILESLVELLGEEGYPIMSAQDGQAALEVLHGAPELPSLILLDLMMPKMDGIAFRERQQLDPRISEIPVILMSADSQIEAKRQRAGIVHHIRKPLRIDPFLEMVSRFAG